MLSRENALHEFLADGDRQTLVSICELDRRQDAALDQTRRLSSDSRALPDSGPHPHRPASA